MTNETGGALVDTAWLGDRLGAPDIRIVDATWFLPTIGRNARREYDEAHIPGAVRFDIDEISDESSDLPHMLPGATRFSARVRGLGLGDGSRIVVYDNNGFCASARVWWMFRVFGHQDTVVLDGGLAKWRAEGRQLEDLPPLASERHFTPRQNNVLVRDLDQMRGNLVTREEQVIDARSAGRFAGTQPEPRAGLRSGHIPGSRNLPFQRLMSTENGTLLPAAELRRRFEQAGVDLSRPVVTTCGSGVTAGILSLALYQLGVPDVPVYDGSWSEWGGHTDTPVEV